MRKSHRRTTLLGTLKGTEEPCTKVNLWDCGLGTIECWVNRVKEGLSDESLIARDV
jgi:hypothetical protein